MAGSRASPEGYCSSCSRGIFIRFGVANRIITDNGTQFTSAAFVEFCEEMGTKICYASPAHPQSNGQAERANAVAGRPSEHTL